MAARAFVAAAAAALATAAVPTTTVFQAYQTGQPECYRQPILVPVTTKPGTLLAFAEGRSDIFHGAGSDPQWCSGTNWPDSIDFPIVVKASSDYGATWGAPVTIMHGNLDFLTAAFDPRSGAVHLLVQLGDDGVVYSRSGDYGASWSPAVNVSIAGPYVSIIPGVGRGLVIDGARCTDPNCGGAAGRILMPFACTVNGTVSNDTACNLCRSCLVASDDGGSSWHLAAVADALVGSRESALAQLDSADWGAGAGAVVYANARNLGPAPGTRMHAVSLDGGSSFAWFGLDPVLPDVTTANWTGVVSGMARVRRSPGRGGDHALVFTAPADVATHARANLTAFVSAGITPAGVSAWAPSRLGSLWPADAAYSDAVQVNETHVGVLFECGTGGDFAAQIAYAALPIDEL
jgi:sialidase-1